LQREIFTNRNGEFGSIASVLFGIGLLGFGYFWLFKAIFDWLFGYRI